VMAAAGMQPEDRRTPQALGEALIHRADGRA